MTTISNQKDTQERYGYPDVPPVRGIRNPSGVSCHLNAALQLLLHSLPQAMIQAFLLVANNINRESLWKELGKFLVCLEGTRCSADPSSLYQYLERETKLEPQSLGDAVTALRNLLRTLMTGNSDGCDNGNDTLLSNSRMLLDTCLYSGKMKQQMVGRVQSKHRRTTPPKQRKLPNPFPVPLRPSLDLAFQEACFTEVIGYNWDGVDYNENSQNQQVDGTTALDSNTEESHVCASIMRTYKSLELLPQTLPPCLFLHIQRMKYQANGRVIVQKEFMSLDSLELRISGSVDDPHLSNRQSSNAADGTTAERLYQLQGAILYVGDDGKQQHRDDEEDAGHYVTLIRNRNVEPGFCFWYLLDDEAAFKLDISTDQLLAFLSGQDSVVYSQLNPAVTDKRGSNNLSSQSYTPVLFAFVEQGSASSKKLMDGLLDQIRNDGLKLEQTDATAFAIVGQAEQPEAFVGRRIKVRWARGKFYKGRVTSYDTNSEKHTVLYDDGDVREYNLGKKTYEWL